MGRRPEKEPIAPNSKRYIINWHVSMDEKRVLIDLSRNNETNLNEYMKRSLLGQRVIVRGSTCNRGRIISRLQEFERLLDSLGNSHMLADDEDAELHTINEIRRSWNVEEKKV